MLSRIQISNFRNIDDARVDNLSSVNVFVGDNGAGKTSFLEAIYTLGHGRSFRKQGGQKDSLVSFGSDRLVVFGERIAASGVTERMGLSRASAGDINIKINGEKVHRVSDAALRLPMIALNAETFELLVGGSSERRRYLDWAVFHVEQVFREASKKYLLALHQRNAMLRAISRTEKVSHKQGALVGAVVEQLDVWTHELCEYGEIVSALRYAQFERLNQFFQEALCRLGAEPLGVELRYRSGWAQGETLAGAIEKSAQNDMVRGFTHFGPHRADIQVVVGSDVRGQSRLARDVLSRGQLKLLVLAMKLAQIMFFRQSAESRTARVNVSRDYVCETLTLILDDVAAELDQTRLDVLGDTLGCLVDRGGVQIFMSATSPDLIEGLIRRFPGAPAAMFHVEQGRLTRIE